MYNTIRWQKQLNIPDMPMGGFSAGPAAAAPAAAPVEEEEAAPAAQEKTLFNLTLKSFDAGAKPKIIKEVKSMLGLSLVDSTSIAWNECNLERLLIFAYRQEICRVRAEADEGVCAEGRVREDH